KPGALAYLRDVPMRGLLNSAFAFLASWRLLLKSLWESSLLCPLSFSLVICHRIVIDCFAHAFRIFKQLRKRVWSDSDLDQSRIVTRNRYDQHLKFLSDTP